MEKRCRSGSRKSCWHESHFTLSTIRRERVRTWRYFTTTKMAAVGSSFGHHCQKYARDRDKKNKKKKIFHAGRYTHTRKINQRVNLNITNWTYESENPCFLSERFTPEWIDESSNCRALRAECITRKSLPDWTELFPGVQKAHYVAPSCLQWP